MNIHISDCRLGVYVDVQYRMVNNQLSGCRPAVNIKYTAFKNDSQLNGKMVLLMKDS